MLRLLLFLFLPLYIFANNSIATTENEPSVYVEGIVNTITGTLCQSSADLVIQGAQPLPVRRLFISGKDTQDIGMQLLPFSRGLIYHPAPPRTITTKDSNGTLLSFIPKGNNRNQFEASFDSNLLGLSNTSRDIITAHTNLSNYHARLTSKREAVVHCPDETERTYRFVIPKLSFNTYTHCIPEYFQLTAEHLPNGCWILYEYDKNNNLQIIRTTNPSKTKTLASLQLHSHYPNIKDSHITTSDGRSIFYLGIEYKKTIQVKKKNSKGYKDKQIPWFRLKKISSPSFPEIEFDYHFAHHTNFEFLSSISLPHGRTLHIDYYHEGAADGRVKALYAPVGHDTTLLQTHFFTYDTTNRATTVSDIEGNKTIYRYHANLRLESIERPGYNLEKFTWEGCNLKSRTLYDPSGKALITLTLTYDPQGNVRIEQVEDRITKYDYTNNLLARKEEPSGKVTTFTYLAGTNLPTSQLVYDKDRLKIRYFYKYNADNILVRETVDDGSSLNEHDLAGVNTRKIKEIIPIASDQYYGMPHIALEKYGKDEKLLTKTVFHYTTGGLIDQKDIYDTNDKLRYSLKTKHNNFGLPLEETNAIGQVAISTYDDLGNKKTYKNFGGTLTTFDYDACNRLTSSTTAGLTTFTKYDKKHRKAVTTDPYGHDTVYKYDAYHLTSTTDALGHTTTYTHNALGQQISVTTPKEHTTKTTYNPFGQPTLVEYPDGTKEKFFYNTDGTLREYIDQEGHTTSYIYDGFGRMTTQTDALGQTTTFTYDAFNLISTTDAEGNITTYTYDEAGRKISEVINNERTEYTYDELGRLASVKKGDLITITEYNLLDQVTEERQEDTSGRLLTKIGYEYDALGNRSVITRYIHNKEAKEVFFYDSLSRLEKHWDALGHLTTISYDDKLHKEATTDPLGLQTITTYDPLGRIASIEKKNSFGDRLFFEENTYDATGNLERHTQNGTHEVKWTYDNMERLESLTECGAKVTFYTYTDGGQPRFLTKPDGIVLEHTYDPIGQLRQLKSSDGSIHYTYGYNRIGQQIEAKDELANTSTHRKYDPLGRICWERLANELEIISVYDEMGRKKELYLPDNSPVVFTYDALHLRSITRGSHTHRYIEYDLDGNLLEKELIGGLSRVGFTYDPIGRKTKVSCPYLQHEIEEYDPASNVKKQSLDRRPESFEYDSLYQLTKENSHTYTYDGNRSRRSKDHEVYEPNPLHQLDTQLAYDPNGNPKTEESLRYTYDALDRLTKVEAPLFTATFYYDAYGRRISKTILLKSRIASYFDTTTTQLFFYDEEKEIGSTDSQGNILEARILNPNAPSERGATIIVELDGKTYAALNDLFGNIAALIDLKGAIAERYSYTAFGEEKTQSRNPWRYASKRADPETGLINFGMRFYSPKHGRWMTPDPAGFVDGYNAYQFVENNPLVKMDLFGLAAEPFIEISNRGRFGIGSFDPVKAPEYQQPVQSLHTNSNTAFQAHNINTYVPTSSVSTFAMNASVGTLHGVGNCGINIATGTAYLGQLISSPLYFLSGNWNRWQTGWNNIQASNTYLRDQWGLQMESLLPEGQRMSVYHNIVRGSEIIADGALVGLTMGEVILARSNLFSAPRATASIAKTIDPNIIRFSQNSIRNKFGDGRLIDDLAKALKSGAIKANEIQPIRLVNRNNMLFTLDNRRLEAFRRAGAQVPYRMATPEEITAETWKFTSSNQGTSIRIRGNKYERK